MRSARAFSICRRTAEAEGIYEPIFALYSPLVFLMSIRLALLSVQVQDKRKDIKGKKFDRNVHVEETEKHFFDSRIISLEHSPGHGLSQVGSHVFIGV